MRPTSNSKLRTALEHLFQLSAEGGGNVNSQEQGVGKHINAAFIAFNRIMITLKRAFLWLARKL